jgi:PAS domain S-box-containing protein
MKMSVRTKFLMLCILLVLMITVGISATYYVLTRQDKQRESQQRIQIAFDIILNDFTKRITTYTTSVQRFLNENITLLWATYSYSLDDSEHGTIRFLFDNFRDVAGELQQFGRVALADRVMLYGANKRLLVLYQRIDDKEQQGGYFVSEREGGRYLPMDDLSTQAELTFRRNNLAIHAINRPFPDIPLPPGVKAEYAADFPRAITITLFRERQQLGIRFEAPIYRRDSIMGLLVGEVFYTQDMVGEYASLSQTDINFFAGDLFSIGTLPEQLSLSREVLAQSVSCQDIHDHLQYIELSSVTFGHDDYYQGRCAFVNDQDVVGAITVSLSQAIEKREIGRLLQTVFTIALIGIFVCMGLVSWIFVPTFANPILRLTNAALRMAQGELEHPIDASGADELGTLARSFVYMRNEIQQKIRELEQLNAELDLRVEARTAEVVRQKYILDTFMATVPDLIYFKDRNGRITRANKAHAGHLGLQHPSEELGKTDFDLFPVEEAQRRYAQEQAILQTGVPLIGVEEQMVLGDGRMVWELTTKMPLRDEHDEIIGTFGISRDITPLKHTEDALRVAKEGAEAAQQAAEAAQQAAEAAQQAAEAANRAKSEFLANMSHELRTPLNVILGLTQLMVRNAALSDDARENLEIIHHSGEHLLSLINNVLDLSKIEAGHMTLQPTNIDLYRLLAELEDMFVYRAERKHVYLSFEREPAVPQYIRADASKLRQVLINLLGNAVKFTERGGVTVRILNVGCELSDVQSPQAIDSKRPSPVVNLTFEIADTGPGVAADDVDVLFEAFAQTHTGRQAQEGTGLGLTICQRFVELMGGRISVDSAPGQGATFIVTVPVQRVGAAELTSMSPGYRVIALDPDQPRYRILVVDDKANNRRVLVKLLAPLGFDVREAANGQEALAVWSTFKPHLIWMDLRMPVIDGLEATRQIKASLQGRATAVIAMTASSFEEERDRLLDAGCDDFVRKPFRDTDIFTVMHKHLGVKYVYEEHAWLEAQASDAENILTPETLQALPPDLYDALAHAIHVTDPGQAQDMLPAIAAHNPALALALDALIKEFRFDILQELCDRPSVAG